ncbi:MAG: carbohydrate esterase family protein, partial [Betaproteobacteria bacterium HGW-Betaproteobacteria-21]
MKQPSPLNPFLATALDTVLPLVSPAGKNARLSVLIYHRVLPTPDPVRAGDPDAKSFRWQMQLLARHFNVLPLHEAAARLRAGALPARAACITFDDGYADNYTIALPILQELGLHATFFVATAYLDGGRMFNDTLIEIAKTLPDGACDLTHVGLGTHKIASTVDRCTLLATLINHFKYLSPEVRIPASDSLAAHFRIPLPSDLMMTSHQLKALNAAG